MAIDTEKFSRGVMTELARDVVFVKGACNGAIYDLGKNRVYSVNAVGCQILAKYINNDRIVGNDDSESFLIKVP